MRASEQLRKIEILLERLNAAVVVRDPGNARAADAYEGLRKSILLSGKNHRSHIAHLLSLSDSLERGADLELLRNRVNDFLFELGVVRFSDLNYPAFFEVIEGEGAVLELVETAVVEEFGNGERFVIRLGKVRRVEDPDAEKNDTSAENKFVEIIEQPDIGSTQEKLRPSRTGRAASLLLAVLLGIGFGWVVFQDGGSDPQPTSTTTTTTTRPSSTTNSPKQTTTSTSISSSSTTILGE